MVSPPRCNCLLIRKAAIIAPIVTPSSISQGLVPCVTSRWRPNSNRPTVGIKSRQLVSAISRKIELDTLDERASREESVGGNLVSAITLVNCNRYHRHM